MKVFYFCHTGAHTAIVAGAIHLGILSKEEVPKYSSFFRLQNFGVKKTKEIGSLLFLGKTKDDTEIYTLGSLMEKELSMTAISSFLQTFCIKEDYILVNTLNKYNPWTELGIRMNYLFGENFIGKKLIVYGLQKNYENIVNIVEQTKNSILEKSDG